MIDFLASAGDVIACAGGVDPLSAVLAGASFGDAYRHSLSDLIHVAQRGLCSSHLMRRDLQVRLELQSALANIERRSSVSRRLLQGSTKNVLSQRPDLSGGANTDTGFTHQPVVVLNPLALDGRGFRGLGAPDDVTGISDKDAHADVTPLRGRNQASSKRRVNELICWCSCFVWGHKNGFDPGNSALRMRATNNHVMLWNSTLSSVPDKVMQTLSFGSCSCGGVQAFQKDGSAESIAYPSSRDVLLETWPGSLTGLVHSTAQSLVLSLRMHACGMGKVDGLNEFAYKVGI